MPKPTAPTLVAGDGAVHREGRSRPTTTSSPAAAGRQCRRSMNCASAIAIRAWSICAQRLSVSGDLDPSAVGNDIYDSYVEAAVRRFQARHGLTIDGVLRGATLAAMNVPATTRRDQLKVNVARLKIADHQSRSALRGRQHSGGARRGDRERRRGVAPYRGRRQAGSGVARHQLEDRRDQFQSVLDGAGLDRAQGFDPAHAGRAGLSDQEPHSHLRRQARRAAAVADQLVFGRRHPLHVSSRTPAISIRSARSASISRASTASICTTRR